MTTPVHTPSKPVNRGAASTGSQRDRRWTDTFFDVHRNAAKFPNGRPFTGEREYKSGTSEPSESAGFITSDLQQGAYFCENPQYGQTEQERQDTLASCWQAPWLPLAKYFRFNYRNKRISYAYEKLISDEREGLIRYWEAAVKMSGDSEVDPERGIVPFKVKVVLGQPSQYTNKIKLAQAAMAGDPWLLGFVEEPNVELAKCLGTRISFLGGHTSDREYTESRIVSAPPVMTPEQALNFSPEQLQKVIAEAIAAHEAQKKADHAAKSAAGKAKAKGAAA